MKRVAIALTLLVAGMWISTFPIQANEKKLPVVIYEQEKNNTVLPVEYWVKIGEEKVILNKETGAGIVRRYYIDPSQHNGIGSTMSAFYKNGAEELLWKGWNLYTGIGMYVVKFKDDFFVSPRVGPATSQMMTLSTLVDFFERNGYGPKGKDLLTFSMCLTSETDDILKTPSGEGVCAVFNFAK